MIFINEWLPNPLGSDTSGEWIELWNSGSEAVNLSGWSLATKSGAKTKLSGEIGAGGYRVFWRKDTKLALKNTDESVALYDNGRLIDRSSFLGSALEGKSFSRIDQNQGPGQHFTWGDPTPGAVNKISLDTSLVHDVYPTGVPLNKSFGPVEFWSLLLGSAVILTALVVFSLKRNENLSKLFFGRD